MIYQVQKTDFAAALKIVDWNYPVPYHVYNLHGSAAALHRLVQGPYYSVFLGGQLIGFFCYGEAAQLKGKKDHDLYQDEEYLDVGLGMHPSWCGKGHGQAFVCACLLFARQQAWGKGFRLTVASNNHRARKVYTRLGFQPVGCIPWDLESNSHFEVMSLDTFVPVPEVALAD